MSCTVGGNGELAERRCILCSVGLPRFRVFEIVDEIKIGLDFFWSGRLHQDVGIAPERVGRLGEGIGRNDRAGQRGRGIHVLQQGAAELCDGCGSVYGYALELWNVFAAMGKGANVRDGRMGEQNKGYSRDMSGA